MRIIGLAQDIGISSGDGVAGTQLGMCERRRAAAYLPAMRYLVACLSLRLLEGALIR